MWAIETEWYAHRPFWQIVMSGVFERFPELRFVLTEQGCAWLPSTLDDARRHAHGRVDRAAWASSRWTAEASLSMTPSEYFQRNVWVGVSFPGVREARAMKKLGLDRMMWGSDYPHHEGSTPFSQGAHAQGVLRLDRRRARPGVHPHRRRTSTASTSAKLEGRAAEVGPTVAELQVPLERIPKGATSPGFYG